MQFIDLVMQQERIREKIDRNIRAVLEHGQYIMGPEVSELEDRLSAYARVRHAVACSSGTDALLLSLMAFGVGPGDAIFTTPFTFIATAEVIRLLGATPVFVDIDPGTFNVNAQNLEKAIAAVKSNDGAIHLLPARHGSAPFLTPRGIIPVDLFGLPADYQAINGIARKHGLFVIGDAAQSFGAECDGRKACSLADIACTSFFPAKPLGCYGDGGMCFTDDDEKAGVIRSLLVHGKGADKYDNVRIGINGRLDTFQAAILNAKFDIFPEEIEMRDRAARRYTELLGRGAQVVPPFVPAGMRSVWAQYSVLSRDGNHRSLLQKKLQDNKIPTAVYYPRPLHLQKAFASLGYKTGDFPVSEDTAGRIFSLPMHPYLSEQDQRQIAAIIHG